MRFPIKTAALLLAATPAFAQTSGVSAPPQEEYKVDAPQKPSAAKPMAGMPAPLGVDEPTSVPVAVPAPAPVVSRPAPAPVASVTSAELKTRVVEKPVDPDADIVTFVPSAKDEIPQGTVIRVRLNEEISTVSTPLGSPFSAQVTQDVVKDGQVIVPAGSTMIGRVTEVRGGKRIRGSALVHLEPQQINLANGTHFVLHAQVIDTDQISTTRIGSEGNIVRRDHAKGTLAASALGTGGAAVAGGMIGGGVGALVGAGVGAGVSTALWLKQDRQLVLAKDSTVDFSLSLPMYTTALKN